jgi:hypothetical protein
MKRVIWKYELPRPGDPPKTYSWRFGTIVHVGKQGDTLMVWASVAVPEKDIAPPKEHRHDLMVVGTGWEFDQEAEHVGTIFDGPFVWHVLRTYNGTPLPPFQYPCGHR